MDRPSRRCARPISRTGSSGTTTSSCSSNRAHRTDDYKFDLVIRNRHADGTPDVVGIRPVNYPDRYLRHTNFEITLQTPNGPADFGWGRDTAFHLEPGLAGDNVSFSFRSVNYPDHFIRHRDFKLRLEPADTATAKADASFRRI